MRPRRSALALGSLVLGLGLAVAADARQDAAPPPVEPPTFVDRLDVVLTTIVVRVVGRDGAPLLGLGRDDFRLLAGDREIAIEAVEWVGSEDPDAVVERELAAGLDAPPVELDAPPRGKLVVFFVQADFHPSRLSGQLRTLPYAIRFLDTLGLQDQAAVVSFDSHLKLRQDFTQERGLVEEALAAGLRKGPGRWPRRPQAPPSLARFLPEDGARRAATPEQALARTAHALEPLPGEKVIVWVGWGLGNLTPLGVRMPAEYGEALAALTRAKASVFVLDVTSADYHTLEEGLKQVVADTGGTYAKTYHFPAGATARLARAVSGHYLLYVRLTATPPGGRPHELRLELRPDHPQRRAARILTPRLITNPEPGR